jgi:hypothetical protein
MFRPSLKAGDALVFDCNGYCGTIPAKCVMCRPEHTRLDRVFVVTSFGEREITYEQVDKSSLR